MEYENYKELLRGRLTENRYYHSLCVADEARRLAIKYGADENDAYLAGLLHDITKNTPDNEQLQILDKFGIMFDNVSAGSKKLWHAVTGAAYIEHILDIKNKEIISAVRYHTTAKADMSLLEKVLYIADFTSLDRNYEDVGVMRKLADESLNSAMIYALKYTINELLDKNAQIHFDTFAAYNYILEGENQWKL